MNRYRPPLLLAIFFGVIAVSMSSAQDQPATVRLSIGTNLRILEPDLRPVRLHLRRADPHGSRCGRRVATGGLSDTISFGIHGGLEHGQAQLAHSGVKSAPRKLRTRRQDLETEPFNRSVNSYLYSLAVVKPDGKRRILLINKRDRPFEITVPGATGGQEEFVNQTTGFDPPGSAKLAEQENHAERPGGRGSDAALNR